MKIGLDTRMINNSGIGTTICGLLDHLTQEQRGQLTLFGSHHPIYPPDFSTGQYSVYGIRQHFGYGRLLNREKLSLFHMPHYDVPYLYNGPLVTTVHDLIHLLFPQYSTKPFSDVYSRWALNRITRLSKRIIVVSRNTQKDLVNNFPQAEEKTVVLYPGVDIDFYPRLSTEAMGVLGQYNLKPGYLLYVGNIRPSKNSRNLIKAYISLKREMPELPPLVMVGKNFYKNINEFKGLEKITFIENVPRQHLPDIYSASSIFIFPSLYEGFGLPPLEAMACGVPVISSRCASLPEVCGDAAEYLKDPSEIEIAHSIRGLFNSPDRLQEMRARGLKQARKFSWDRFAQGTWDVYQDVLRTGK